jgi:ParB-like chromosome segregation protein Spo0J
MIESIKQHLAAAAALPLDQRVEIYNQVSALMKEFVGLPHPVLGVKLVKAEQVRANDYNPNVVAPPEMTLLKLSIRKDGVTMPVVAARADGEKEYTVVDGFHRTTIIKTCSDVNESLGGYVPLVELNKGIEDRITATVRHNIARGTHQVELSAKLVTMLKKHNWTNARIGKELGMDPDEVLRLKQITGLAEAFKDHEFSKSWTVENGEEVLDATAA